jgi:putative membrane protein (TIGR04086 family)
MNSETGSAPAFDLRAVGIGLIWGIGVMMVSATIQAMVVFSSPLSTAMEGIMAMVWQALGAATGGLVAAKRAAGTGWLHGAITGMLLVLLVAALMGVVTALPAAAPLLKMLVISTIAGLLGGVLGVNVTGR